VRFYLGVHRPAWLERTDVPLFVSRRVLVERKSLPVALGPWALDSGGFTELSMFGAWRTTPTEYVSDVRRFERGIGRLEWVAPQDWMCEPHMLALTGLTVEEHQARTVGNFLALRQELGALVVPVLQGWTADDYMACWDRYHRAGVDLEWEPVVGLGTVCRRQNTAEAGVIVRRLAENLLGRQLHGFGVKLTGLESFGDELGSADSMAWSFTTRRSPPLPGCAHESCTNCLRYALRWRANLLERLGQERLALTGAAEPRRPDPPPPMTTHPYTRITEAANS
jgi:hypothetical protein